MTTITSIGYQPIQSCQMQTFHKNKVNREKKKEDRLRILTTEANFRPMAKGPVHTVLSH